MKLLILRVVYVAVLLVAANAAAHHNSNAGFTTNIIDVEGCVTEFSFTNPHVNFLFDVTDDNGETTQWLASSSAANRLRRSGWTADTIQPGQFLRVSGRETHDGSPMILIIDIIELNPLDRSIVRNVQGESDYQEPVSVAPVSLKLADGRPNLNGDWTAGEGRRGGPPREGYLPSFNELGAAAQADFDPVRDPAANCELPGMIRQAVFTPHPVRVTQNDDHVILEYEEYAGRRVIYFDDRELQNAEHTKLGHSIAHYDGDAVVIETTQLLGNYTSPRGHPLSDQTTTVETYRRKDDPDVGPVLSMEIVITDPAHLAVPWVASWEKQYSPGYEFIEVDCRVTFTYGDSD